MARQIFVNLPVADLPRSVEFFAALGFAFNPQWTDKDGTGMIVGHDMYVMLLSKERFASFTPRPVADATQTTEMLVCLSLDSREAVDELVAKAVSLGATTWKEAEDHGFMYGQSFQDLDGHIWELIHLNPTE